jgi:WD40 repeat protein
MAARTRKPGRPTDLELYPELELYVRALDPVNYRQPASLSADGRRVALSPGARAVHVWDTGRGRSVGAVLVRRHPCGLSLSPDGTRLAIDAGTTIYVHDAETLVPLVSWKAKYSYVPRLAWSPDVRLLARTDRSTTSRLYDVETGRQVAALGAKPGVLTSVAFAPDGLTFGTGTLNGRVRVWDVG